MKRLYIAIGLVVVTAALCTCQIKTIGNITDKYCDVLDEISDTLENGDKQKAQVISEDMLISWNEELKKLDKYVYHDYVDNITVALSEIPLYVKNASVDEMATHINGIKIQLASLKESEQPYIHNII